jgi:NADPH-dependent glutamate synthase beta subunit-like oxidoreductase
MFSYVIYEYLGLSQWKKVLVSIGYKGIPLDGMDESIFDEKRGIVRNNHGRVGGGEKGGLYVSGWLKRGPSGIIGTNITDAKDTVMSIIEDIMDNKIELSVDNSNIKKGRDGLDTLLMERNIQKVDWANYEKIDASEKDPSRLRSKKQPREKFTSLNEMLSLTK